MATLSSAHKTLIVQRLATFVADKEIIEELRTLGVDVTYAQIAYYNPKTAGSKLGKEWVELFNATRAQFTKDTSAIAIANKAYRLTRLDAMARAAEAKKNYPLAASLHEQAAKEVGEAYTNRRVIEAADPHEALAKMLGISVAEIAGALSGASASET